VRDASATVWDAVRDVPLDQSLEQLRVAAVPGPLTCAPTDPDHGRAYEQWHGLVTASADQQIVDEINLIANGGWMDQGSKAWRQGGALITIGLEPTCRELAMLNVPRFCPEIAWGALSSLAVVIQRVGRTPGPRELIPLDDAKDGWQPLFAFRDVSGEELFCLPPGVVVTLVIPVV